MPTLVFLKNYKIMTTPTKKILQLLLVLIVIMSVPIKSFSQLPSYVDTSGLKGWWPFNGNANAGIHPDKRYTVLGAMDLIMHF